MSRANDLASLIKSGTGIDSDGVGIGAISEQKIKNGAVTAQKLAPGAAATTGKAIAMSIVFG